MIHDDDDVASLRSALAAAERGRQEALSRVDDLLRRHRDERREAQHHLRNFLSVIRSITRRTAEEAEDVESYSALLDGRLSVYMHLHAAIAGNLRLGTDLASLAAEELLRFRIHESDTVRIEGPQIRLDAAAAGLMALAFHELVSQWVLSGRSSAAAAGLNVVWNIVGEDGAGSLVIDWSENRAKRLDEVGGSSTWMRWIDLAIRHQVGGSTAHQFTRTQRSHRFTLPAGSYVATPAMAD